MKAKFSHKNKQKYLILTFALIVAHPLGLEYPPRYSVQNDMLCNKIAVSEGVGLGDMDCASFHN